MTTEVSARGSWGNKIQFLLSCFGYSASLGTVWRFPYLCYRNGGATFLIPYFIMMLVLGLPIMFLEMALGQFASEGPITVWKVSPAFQGIGVAMVIILSLITIYYNTIVMYAIYYMLVSFVNLDGSVPWGSCGNTWNTNTCRSEPFPSLALMDEANRTRTLFKELYNQPCVESLLSNISDAYNSTFNSTEDLNSTMIQDDITKRCLIKYTTTSEEYWERHVLRLHESDGFEDLGGLSLKNTIYLFFAWVLVFFCLKKGIKTSGKVVYFTATFPYAILLVLLIRGMTLPGHEKGVAFFTTLHMTKLTEAKVWRDAASQVFFCLASGFGTSLAVSSYNKFNSNCERDAIIITFFNCVSSVLSGFTTFSVLGFMAHTSNQDIESVVDQGPGLAFIAYPESIAKLPVSSLWAFLFFFMLFSLGVDTQFTSMQTIMSGISDMFPRFLRPHKTAFTAFCCLVGFLLGLPFVTKGGIYVLTLMDWYSGSYSVMLMCVAEIVCIMYVYGVKRFGEDIKMMLGHRPNPCWIISWVFLTPVTLMFLLVVSAIQYTPAFYGDYTFLQWAESIGWCLVAFPLTIVILIFVVQISRLGPRDAFSPTTNWGPAKQEDRTGRYSVNAKVPNGNALDSISVSTNTEEKPSAKCGSGNHRFYSNKM